jgi:serine/threonine protein phosphatase 1
MEFCAPGRLPSGLRVYAIGDVHGCLEQLVALHGQIAQDWVLRPVARCVVLYLGDYVDRGPDSAGVIALLTDGPGPVPEAETIALIGNHEAMMLAAIAAGPGTVAEDTWLWNGGDATLASYGTRTGPLQLPPAHMAWLQGLRISWQAGDYFFVHGGIDPRRALDAQRRQDMLWIREPFLSWPRPLPAVIVHGHTPSRVPELRSNRIGIDTGAVAGGPLTCLALDADSLRFFYA